MHKVYKFPFPLYNMTKSLVKKIREGIVLFGAMATMTVAGCKFPGGSDPSPIPPTTKPQVSLTVDPLSGTQISRIINVNGTDSGGDIMNYEAFADYNNNGIEDNGELLASSSIPINGSYNLNKGNFKIYGQVRDSEGNIDKKSIDVVVSNPPQLGYVNISGTLQDDETRTGQSGVIKVYDTRTQIQNSDGTFTFVYSDPIKDKNTGQYEISANSGNFSFTLDKLADSTDTIYFRTEAMIGGIPSYVRTVTLPAEDQSLSIEVVPSMTPNETQISSDDFVSFAKSIYGKLYNSKTGTSYYTIEKFNIPHVEIANPSAYDGLLVSFTDRTNITNAFTSLKRMLNIYGASLDLQNDYDNPPITKNYTVDASGNVSPKANWHIIFPDLNNNHQSNGSSGNTNIYYDSSTGNYIDGVSYLSVSSSVTFGSALHEIFKIGEAIFDDYNFQSIPPSGWKLHDKGLSVMDPYTTPIDYNPSKYPTSIDQKIGSITWGPTYQTGENLDDILGASSSF